MKNDQLLYNRSVQADIASNDLRSQVPFRLSLASNEVIQIRRVVFFKANQDEYAGIGKFHYMVGLSSADLAIVTDTADTDTAVDFSNRHDIVLSHHFEGYALTPAALVEFENPVMYDFEPGQILLPRSPTLVMVNQVDPSDDDTEVLCTIYYNKLVMSQNDILILMKIYKSIKAATIPRVIDE